MPFLLLMPSYNQARYVREAIASIVAQDDPDWELWIVDNSTDDSPAVIRGFQDPRIKLHHIPARMDPGTCLNWMLERARGEHFSYVHTDNNLHPSYVRSMRAALATHPLALAYCDTRVLDGDGRRTAVCRRGAFDLARLFSLDPLGVPFAATTKLAQSLGGFSSESLADDVRFCAGAYGIAQYAYVREPLVDYRSHGQSRTSAAGGMGGVRRTFYAAYAGLKPRLQQRGVDVTAALAVAAGQALDDLELYIEDLWYRKLSRVARPWWQGDFEVRRLFDAGLLPLPGLDRRGRGPAWSPFIRGDGVAAAWPWHCALMAAYLKACRRELRRLTEKVGQVLGPWAHLELGEACRSVQVGNLSFRTVLAGRILEHLVDCKPVVAAGVGGIPSWLGWPAAAGHEPRLAVGRVPSVERPS